MSYKGREIESKLITSSRSITRINSVINSLFESEITNMAMGISTDYFWTAPTDSPIDFVRLRDGGIDTYQITVKGKDKADRGNLNRIELEISSYSDKKTITRFLDSLLGRSSGKVGKMYYVYFLENSHTNVSVYTITDVDPEYTNIIIEVEARSEERMLQLEAKVLRGLADKNIKAERSPGSLYEMFILHRG